MNVSSPINQQINSQQTIPQPALGAKKKFLFWGLIAFGILIALGSFYFIKQANAATVSGIINYTALKPDPTDKGQVLIKYRKYGTQDAYKTAFTSILENKSPWTWNDAVSGQPYEITAELVIDEEVVTSSEPLVVTAPATAQELDLRVTWHNLPASVVSEEQTFIKGTVAINGAIPPGSEVHILANETNSSTFQVVAINKSPTNSNAWEWDGATPLKDYLVHAVLVSNGLQIGTSATTLVAGGDAEVVFSVNSTANLTPSTPSLPVPQTSLTPTQSPTVASSSRKISGTIFINGPKDKDTSLLLLWRKPGQGNYQVINRINFPSHNGQIWEWDNPPAGSNYEITTALQVNDQNTATSNSQIVAAPAQNINFTLNTGVIVNTPGDKPSLAACTQQGSQWDATIKYPVVQNAGNYWFQIGTNPGANDTSDSKTPAAGNDTNKTVTVRIDNNRTYYTRYAYSICVNCSNNVNFSNFADSFPFSCGGNGNNYTGYRCNTSHYACELTTDPNPPYNFNNDGLSACQRACQPPTPTLSPLPTVAPTQTPTPLPTAAPLPTATPTIGISPKIQNL
jgi:hypothetical protein